MRPLANHRPDARAGGLVLLRSELAKPLADELLFGQLFEGFGDAELFLTEARAVAEKTLGVFVEGRVAEAHVGSRAVSAEEPSSFLEIETRALSGEADEVLVRLLPRGVFELQSDC